MTPKATESPIGTIVKIVDRKGYLVALDPEGREVHDVPGYAMKKAFETGCALLKQPTRTGSFQWRQKDIDLYAEAQRNQAEHPTDIDVGQVDHVVSEDVLSHDEIINFLEKAYDLKPELLKIDPVKWKFAIRTVLRGENLLVMGEAGCGKTLLATTVAKALNRPLFYFSFGAAQDPRSMLIGNTHFTKDKGTFVARALFVKAIQTPNAVILLDEFTRAHPDAHNILMTVLDRTQRYLRIDEETDTPTIKVAQGVSFIATANVGTEYTGTRTLDRAMKDRFTILVMEPLSKDDEVDLLSTKFPDVPGHLIKAVAEIADITRSEVKSDTPKVDTILSTRATVEITGLLYDGFSLAEAAEVCIYPFYSDAGGTDSPRTYMRSVVQKNIPDAKTAKKANPFQSGDPNGGALTPWGD